MKWNQKYGKLLQELIALLFIVLFVYTAMSKLEDFEKFRIQIGQSPILTSIGSLIVWIIPIGELLVALMLLTHRWRPLAFYLCFILMTLFTTYIVLILNFSPFVPCSCGGVLSTMGWKSHLIFNLVFMAFALVGILISSSHNSQSAS